MRLPTRLGGGSSVARSATLASRADIGDGHPQQPTELLAVSHNMAIYGVCVFGHAFCSRNEVLTHGGDQAALSGTYKQALAKMVLQSRNAARHGCLIDTQALGGTRHRPNPVYAYYSLYFTGRITRPLIGLTRQEIQP